MTPVGYSPPRLKRATRGATQVGAMLIMVSAALGVVQFFHPARAPLAPFANVSRLAAGASMNSFGTSREVRVTFALPAAEVEFPLEVSGNPSALTYEWVASRDSTAFESVRPVIGASFVAPSKPGFYRLAIVKGTERHIIPEPMLAVMVPFKQRIGGMLNGYRIGTYVADRLSQHDHPDGFLEVGVSDVDLRITTHLRLGDVARPHALLERLAERGVAQVRGAQSTIARQARAGVCEDRCTRTTLAAWRSDAERGI